MENTSLPPLQTISVQVKEAVDEARLQAGRQGLWSRPSRRALRMRRSLLLLRWLAAVSIALAVLCLVFIALLALLRSQGEPLEPGAGANLIDILAKAFSAVLALIASAFVFSGMWGWEGLLFGKSAGRPTVQPYTLKVKPAEMTQAEAIHTRCRAISERISGPRDSGRESQGT